MSGDTLPGYLPVQAQQRGDAVALRHKHLGIWYEQRWQQVARDVQTLAAALRARGFKENDQLYLLSHPRPQALLLQLAAQWLGGVAAPIDIDSQASQTVALLRQLRPEFVFAAGESEISLLQIAGIKPHLVLFADARGLTAQHEKTWLSYADALKEPPEKLPELRANAANIALAFYQLDVNDEVQRHTLSHAELLGAGEHLLRQEHITASDEALAARAFASSGHARYLQAPWLLTGFKLNFPENLATRDNDRRELGPTLVAGSSATYQRLATLVQERLPVAGSLRRRLVDWGLQPSQNPLRRWLAEHLVTGPLRDVIGLARTRFPLLVGERLPNATQQFFRSIGINVRGWEAQAGWQPLNLNTGKAPAKENIARIADAALSTASASL